MNQFIESLRRLYNNKKVSKETIVKLFDDSKISVKEKLYILDTDEETTNNSEN